MNLHNFLSFLSGPITQDQQLMATLVSERSKVTHLEKEIQTKEATLQTVMKELDSYKSSLIRDRRMSSESSSMAEQEEIRRILLSSPESDSDLALQNERLKYDLDKSIGERRVLSQQMENWKNNTQLLMKPLTKVMMKIQFLFEENKNKLTDPLELCNYVLKSLHWR